MPNTTNHVSRVSRVSEVVTASFAAVSTKDQDRRDAKDVLTGASNDAVNTREGQLVALSQCSASEKWEISDIEDGIDAALKQRNGKDTAINTFAGELKRACHPAARNHVPSLQDLAQNVWDAELATEDKSAPRPLRNAFVRRYHMLQRMVKRCIEDKQVLKTPAEVAEWAISLDPAKDPDKAFKRRTAIRAQIQAMLDEFPNIEQLRACIEELGTITKRDFEPIEQPKSVVKPAEVRKSPPQAAPNANTPKLEELRTMARDGDIDAADVQQMVDDGEITKEDAATITFIEPAMGVSDLLDEALRDIEAA